MTIKIFLGAVALAIVFTLAAAACLICIYKAGEERGTTDAPSIIGVAAGCGVVGIFALIAFLTITRSVVWSLII